MASAAIPVCVSERPTGRSPVGRFSMRVRATIRLFLSRGTKLRTLSLNASRPDRTGKQTSPAALQWSSTEFWTFTARPLRFLVGLAGRPTIEPNASCSHEKDGPPRPERAGIGTNSGTYADTVRVRALALGRQYRLSRSTDGTVYYFAPKGGPCVRHANGRPDSFTCIQAFRPPTTRGRPLRSSSANTSVSPSRRSRATTSSAYAAWTSTTAVPPGTQSSCTQSRRAR